MKVRAIVAHGVGDLRSESISLRQPGPSDAVVAIRLGGICGSDLHYWRSGRVGTSVLREPMVLGHEVVGDVVSAAADGSGPGVGTPVFVHPASTCGRCRYCLSGRRNLCREMRYLGSAAQLPHTPGGFADQIVVGTSRLLPVDGIASRDAVLIEPASVAWHAVARIAVAGGSVAGARVAVLGAGPIGLLCVAALEAAGAAEILATDLHERPLRLARSLGATATLRAEEAEALRDWSPDHVLESSGSGQAMRDGLDAIAPGGVLVAVGQPPVPREVDMPRVVSGEITISGSSRFVDDPTEVIAAIRNGRLRLDGVVSDMIPADRFLDAFELAAESAASSKVLLEFA
jgi:L-idonate 5-dehydrogenase